LSASCWRSSFRLADNSLGFHLPLQRTPPVIDGHGRNSAHPFAGRVSDSFFLLSPSFSGAVVQTSQTTNADGTTINVVNQCFAGGSKLFTTKISGSVDAGAFVSSTTQRIKDGQTCLTQQTSGVRSAAP